jgi:hypothetical protein
MKDMGRRVRFWSVSDDEWLSGIIKGTIILQNGVEAYQITSSGFLYTVAITDVDTRNKE